LRKYDSGDVQFRGFMKIRGVMRDRNVTRERKFPFTFVKKHERKATTPCRAKRIR
jgi:hypothetical protein